MKLLASLRSIASVLSHRHRAESELDEELRVHIQNRSDDLQRSGLSHTEADRRARIEFGARERFKEECREARSTYFLETFFADVRFGIRMLRKNPGFTIVAVATLALGIGAGTAVFSVVDSVLLKPLPYSHPDRIVMPWWRAPISSAQGIDQFPWGMRDFARFSKETSTFQSVGAFKSDFFNLVDSADPARLDGLRVSAGFFSALGITPSFGRTFTPEEDQPGHQFEVILSDQLWRERFNADPGILGRTMVLNAENYTVVGVMPHGFAFPRAEEMPVILTFAPKVQLWVPLEISAAPPGGPSELALVGRLRPGVTLQQAQAELRIYGSRQEKEFASAKGWYNPNVVSLTQQVVGDTGRPLLLLLGAVGVVLLIASANVASLLLTRSLGRRQEFTLRSALGAGRARLVRQILTESLLLAAAGGVAGVLVSEAAIHAVRIFGPANIPRLNELGLEPRVFLFAIGISFVTGILFGTIPALGTARENLVTTLKEGERRSGGSAAHPRIRNALLVTQVALALVLVVSAGLLVRTLYRMLGTDAGFNPAHVLTFQLSLPASKYKETDQMAQVYSAALRALKPLAGVQSVGIVSEVPLGGATDGTSIRVPDHPNSNGKEYPFANYSFASPGYFSAIGTPLLRGRDFLDTDIAGSAPVAIINAAMARRYWPGEDPLGRQVGVAATRWPTRTIVGIVADIKHSSLRESPDPEMYVPYTQNEIKVWPSMQTMQVALRGKVDPTSLAAAAREAIHSVDPDLPLAKITTLDDLVDDSLAQPRFSVFLVGSFGLLALVLATVGMYGVISFSVAQRTHEIGIRMALGAERNSILGMVLVEGFRLGALGIAIGVVAALAVTRLMTSFLYGIQTTDPLTFASVSLLLAAVALLACYLPARRATQVDPMIALRHE